MNTTEQNEQLVYTVSVGDIQEEARRIIGRELTDDETDTAKKCVEWGFSSVIFITLRAAIEAAVK